MIISVISDAQGLHSFERIRDLEHKYSYRDELKNEQKS